MGPSQLHLDVQPLALPAKVVSFLWRRRSPVMFMVNTSRVAFGIPVQRVQAESWNSPEKKGHHYTQTTCVGLGEDYGDIWLHLGAISFG